MNDLILSLRIRAIHRMRAQSLFHYNGTYESGIEIAHFVISSFIKRPTAHHAYKLLLLRGILLLNTYKINRVGMYL